MGFKQLYQAVAQRHPEHCKMRDGRITLESMGWLREIEHDLKKIAINQNGLWHLRRTISVRYERAEWYKKVWEQPIQEIASEFGVSDVAIAKVCRKWRIPTPGIGYWAKKRAGKPVQQAPPLPLEH
jgi:hypothetical protein